MNLCKADQKFKEQCDRFFETVKRPASCIFCNCTKIYWNGQRQRTASVKWKDEMVYHADILCKRVKCADPECKKSWTLRPPGLMPRRHYQLCVVASAGSKFLFDRHATLTLVAEAHCCCRRTVGRWLQWIAGIAEPKELMVRLFNVSKNRALKVTDIFSQAVSRGREVFQRATENLCILEALGKACGYESPGLKGVVEAVVSNRDRITTYNHPFIPELAR
jgi:hypothetical protein